MPLPNHPHIQEQSTPPPPSTVYHLRGWPLPNPTSLPNPPLLPPKKKITGLPPMFPLIPTHPYSFSVTKGSPLPLPIVFLPSPYLTLCQGGDGMTSPFSHGHHYSTKAIPTTFPVSVPTNGQSQWVFLSI